MASLHFCYPTKEARTEYDLIISSCPTQCGGAAKKKDDGLAAVVVAATLQ
jgi:hypothetical protein